MLLHAVPGGHSEAVPYSGSGFYKVPPCFGQRIWISRRHDPTGLTDNQRGIPHVGHDAGRSARHGFTDYKGKGFATDGSSSCDIHPGKEARHISAQSQEMTAVTNACGIDPSRQPRVLPVDVKAAEQEVNVGHLFV